MKRSLLVLFLISTSCLGLPAVSAAKPTSPTLFLDQSCYRTPEGVQVYGANFGVTGFPPDTAFDGTLVWQDINPDGSYGPSGGRLYGTVHTDANGEWTYFLGATGQPTRFTWTVDSPYIGGTQTKTLSATCEPATVDDCKNGGYRIFNNFNFKNEGQCVAFVQRGPGPGEANDGNG